MLNRRFVGVAVVLAGLLSSPVPGDVVTIGALKDNTLYEDATGSLSNGAGQHFFAGRTNSFGIRRGLLAFDVAAHVPSGAIVTGVTLTLHAQNSGGGPQSMDLHRLVADWGEAGSDAGIPGGAGAPAEPGDATWLHTFFDSDFWATPGGDFLAAVSGTQTVDSGGFYTWSGAQMVADVQNWLDTPLGNYGWILRGNELQGGTSKRFDTREHPTEANRPALTIEYQVIPAPATLAFLVPLVARSGRRRRIVGV